MIIKYIAIGAVSLMLLGCGGGGSSSSTTPETPENSVIINEVLASNKTIIADPQYDKYSDWIELYNTSDSDVNLGGYGLSDSAKGASWFFPQGTTIQAKNYLLVWADDKNSTTSLHTDFKLSKSGDKVVLYAVDGTLLERLDFKEQYSDVSYARDDNAKYVKTLVPTPKRRNEIFEALESEKPTASLKNGVYATEQEVILSATPGAKIYYELDGDDVTTLSDVYTTPLKIHTYTELRAASLELEQGKMLSSELSKTYVIAKNIRINEILADNNSSNVDEDGDYGDWIELYNDSASYVRLDGYGLSDSKKGFTWKFPANTAMQARSYLLVWADDKNNSTHTDFKLSAKDDKVVLFDELGVVIDLVEFKDQHQDYSYAKDANKTFQETSFVTPLAVNVIAKVDKADFSPDGGV
ncbi:MAG: lamin tail domain-containing protein, partial [Campylobacterota bacterium]|nr:lamin tail domain-containing protein [Campylobacterota bacterium]